jgi:hypothetical protein
MGMFLFRKSRKEDLARLAALAEPLPFPRALCTFSLQHQAELLDEDPGA